MIKVLPNFRFTLCVIHIEDGLSINPSITDAILIFGNALQMAIEYIYHASLEAN